MNLATSSGIGAAAEPAHVTWSRPRISLRKPRIASSASAYASSISGVISRPVPCASTHASPAAMASCDHLPLAGSGSAASLAETPVLIFSHTRGTPKNAVGCTSPSVARSCDGSPMACMWLPWICGP